MHATPKITQKYLKCIVFYAVLRKLRRTKKLIFRRSYWLLVLVAILRKLQLLRKVRQKHLKNVIDYTVTA